MYDLFVRGVVKSPKDELISKKDIPIELFYRMRFNYVLAKMVAPAAICAPRFIVFYYGEYKSLDLGQEYWHCLYISLRRI